LPSHFLVLVPGWGCRLQAITMVSVFDSKVMENFMERGGFFFSLSLSLSLFSLGGIKKYFVEYLLKKHNKQNVNNLLFSLPKY
jgi:hypothetical protein